MPGDGMSDSDYRREEAAERRRVREQAERDALLLERKTEEAASQALIAILKLLEPLTPEQRRRTMRAAEAYFA